MGKKYMPAILIAFAISAQMISQDSVKVKSEYLPDLDGILKTKVEYDLDNSLLRFEVRNARFGVKGSINDYMSYRMEIDLSDEGKMKMLDAYVRLTPLKNFDVYLGQRKIPFSTDYMRNPAETMFANRSFVAKNINDGLRDIGFYIDYKLSTAFPVNILIGAVNGTGNNNPQWIERPNLVGRLIAGHDSRLRVVGNIYSGESLYKDQLFMFGGELRYSRKQFFIESEYVRCNYTDTVSARVHNSGFYLHTFYNIKTKSKMIRMVTPLARFDIMGCSISGTEASASRITLGINAGFEMKQFYSELRLNYENYLKSSLPIHTDKLTVEFIGRF